MSAIAKLTGHTAILNQIRSAIKAGRLGHAYLFVGPDGIGKRRLAIHLAQSLLCETRDPADLAPCGTCAACAQVLARTHPDLLEVRRPEDKMDLPIATIQNLVEGLSLKPARGRHKIAIVDDADSMNEDAANCFLKTLEEPPPKSLLMLLATHAETQLPTIRSRCQILALSPLSDADVAAVLLELGAAESAPKAQLMAHRSGGSVGLAMEMSDPAWSAFIEELNRHLFEASLNVPKISEEILRFVEEAGKDSASKRARARKIISLVVTTLSDGLQIATSVREEQSPLSKAAHRWGADVIADMIDRSFEAEYHVDRLANLPLALESWIDDLGRMGM